MGVPSRFCDIVFFLVYLVDFLGLFSKIKSVLVYFNMGSNCLKKMIHAHFTIPVNYLAQENTVDRLNLPPLSKKNKRDI